MRAQQPPFCRTLTNGVVFKISVLNHLHRRAIGIFNHRNVVDQRLPGVQKTQQELMPVSGIIAPGRFAAGTAIGDRLPGAVVGFIARRPGFRSAAVRMGVHQFQRGPSTVGQFRPTTALEIRDLIHEGICAIPKSDAIPAVAKGT